MTASMYDKAWWGIGIDDIVSAETPDGESVRTVESTVLDVNETETVATGVEDAMADMWEMMLRWY